MGEVSMVIDDYDDKSLLLIDLIDFWQTYKQKHTDRRPTKYRNLRGGALNWWGTYAVCSWWEK